ncbi:flavodoxin family protein [Methanobrevibacter filiformis]|uniref:NAD(P)H dehydrogenase n=1 Tax=Methanobrevibacter filiformis TaxID=55758 RepID=A0A166EZA6_9EURY|nr:flavodoxin [Methanobrevibacter filiformis]KZX17165.1 NAD(P)H dehydrogenase [Methanobrevibacter filiformis]
MKILVTYYSRTQTTEKIAKKIAKELGADLEEIVYSNESKPNYLLAGLDAIRKKSADIKPITKDPSDYDIVIIGTPVWAATMATPILTYLTENKEKFNRVSFISTAGGSSASTIAKMTEIVEKDPIAILTLNKEEIKSNPNSKINEFVNSIKNIV